MKKLFLIAILLILFTFSVKASLEADYIVSQSKNTIEKTAYAVLALRTETGYSSQISSELAKLKTNIDTCTLDDSCNVKDVALSILALEGSSTTTLNKAITWLINSRSIQYSGELSGWLVQVVSSGVGTCILNNTETGQQQTITIQSDYTPWISIDSNVLTSNTRSLILDCSDLSRTGLILSLIQRKTVNQITHYYVKQEEHGQNIITVEFGDPCWGSTFRSTCNKDITALALYTLKKSNTQADSSWLTQQTSLTPLQNAYLYKITSDNKYLTVLETSQNSAGDWDQEVYTTAMISYLIKPHPELLTKANSWIQQNKDTSSNCWTSVSCDVITTAVVLMAKASAYTTITDTDNDGLSDDDEVNIYETDPNNPDTDEDGVDDGDEIDAETDPLDPDDFPTTNGGSNGDEEECEEGDSCTTEQGRLGTCNFYGGCVPDDYVPPDDECIYGEDCTTDQGCDGTCNIYNECDDIAGDDCPYSGTQPADTTTPSKDEEEGRSIFFWFLLFLLFLIALGGGTYLAYKKGLLKFKKKPPKRYTPVYEPKLKPTTKKSTAYKPQMHHRKSPIRKHMESALERSMKEMEDLLKGK